MFREKISMSEAKPAGVYVAAITPFDDKLRPDAGAYIAYCRWLLANGCDGLAPFGTTGEGPSLAIAQKLELVQALIEAGLDPQRMIPGTGAVALADAVTLTAGMTKLGVAGSLALPPFYYKNPTEDGLFAFYAALIERVGDARLRLYLYHFPQMSAVPITLALVERLLKAYPGVVVGLKDSSGDWTNSETLLKTFPGFRVFSGSEQFLLPNLRLGGPGCISATVNLTAPLAAPIYANWESPDAEALQEGLSQARLTLQRYPLIPALKEVAAYATGNRAWLNMIPPTAPLPRDRASELIAALQALPQVAPLLRRREAA